MSIDTRVFEVHHHYADDPELDGSQYWTLAQMKGNPKMKPIYDESLYCQECDTEISVQEDLFNGHLCDGCAFSEPDMSFVQVYARIEEEKEDRFEEMVDTSPRMGAIDFEQEAFRHAFWNYLTERVAQS